MTLLTPLGLLGLLGIVALIIIYIIRPNYQQKLISSTFIWQLSLKRKKRRLPVSKLRNLLLILCQILILAACAAILASPMKIIKSTVTHEEAVIIIDSSASMRATTDGETRFHRAVNGAIELADSILQKEGKVSVILADEDPAFLIEKTSGMAIVRDVMEPILLDELACSYGVSDIDKAVTMCADMIDENPNTKLYIFTDNEYYSYDASRVTLMPMAQDEEWNAALLKAYTEKIDGTYVFTTEVATYGVDMTVEVKITVTGANASSRNEEGEEFTFIADVPCRADTPQMIVFTGSDSIIEDGSEDIIYVRLADTEQIFSYQQVEVSIDQDDSFADDNKVYIYGGKKPIIRIQYASTLSNNFINGILMVLKDKLGNDWDIRLTESNKGEPAVEGYDFYIFEHSMPRSLPVDGVVMLINPDYAPNGADFRVDKTMDLAGREEYLVSEVVDSPILKNMDASAIFVTQYQRLSAYDSGYQVLMECNGSPMLLFRDEGPLKTVVLPFSLHYSNLALLQEFPLLFLNLFRQYFPTTVSGNAFEVGAEIGLNARGDSLSVEFSGSDDEPSVYTEFPFALVTDLPGTYTLSQTTYFGVDVEEKIYVKIPASESNIHNVEDDIVKVYSTAQESDFLEDLMFYIALALVILLFAEWLLHTKEGI